MRRIISLFVIVFALLVVSVPAVKAQVFQVNYSWQYPEAPGQHNCVALNFCGITFPAQNGLPWATVAPYYYGGRLRIHYNDGNGNSGSAPVDQPVCGTDDCTFSIVDMTVYNNHGTAVGTMNETFHYTVVFEGGLGCPSGGCIKPRSATLQ